MGDEFIPDYSRYDTSELIDVYKRIDKINNPKRTLAIEDELRRKLNIDRNLNFKDESVKDKLDNFLKTGKFEDKEITKCKKKIRNGWITGVVVATLTLILTVIALKLPEGSFLKNDFDKWSFIDVIIVYGLSYGIYKKNKVSAILLLIFFLLPRVISLIETGNFKFMTGGSILVAYFLFEAIRGISEIHKINSKII